MFFRIYTEISIFRTDLGLMNVIFSRFFFFGGGGVVSVSLFLRPKLKRNSTQLMFECCKWNGDNHCGNTLENWVALVYHVQQFCFPGLFSTFYKSNTFTSDDVC